MRPTLQLAITVGVVVLYSVPKESLQQQLNNSTEVLRAATIIFRHGERNPIKSYPGDPYEFETVFWPEGYGAMTMPGKVRMYNLGWYMRKRYPTFQRKNVVVYSSASNRTITSAMANLAGFYGQNRSFLRHIDSYNPKGLGINIIPKLDDDFIMMEADLYCPRYTQLRQRHLHETRPMEKYKDALEIINKYTGLNFSTYNIDIMIFADTIIIQKSKGLTLPDWIQNLYDDDLFFELRDEYFLNIMPTLELKRLRSGGMLKRFLDEMDLVVDDVEHYQNLQEGRAVSSQLDFPRTMVVSGHDSTIATWMIDLEIFDWENIPYGAAIFVELYEVGTKLNKTVFIIKMFYKNDAEREPIQMTLPGCPNPCYYSNFKKMLQPLVLHNRKEECRISNLDVDNETLKSYETSAPTVFDDSVPTKNVLSNAYELTYSKSVMLYCVFYMVVPALLYHLNLD